MSDMLVNLMLLDKYTQDLPDLSACGINVRRVMPYERAHVMDFAKTHFGVGWASEVEMAFFQHPVTCFIATCEGKIVGFAAFECTSRDFFGPTGVDPAFRNKGIGRVLLVKSLQALREMGYAYAVIGGAGPQDFYTRCAGAAPIPDSVPGVYLDGLKPLE